MPDVLVPVGRHLFSPSDITALASTITPADVGAHGFAGKIGFDNDGVEVMVVFSPKGDHFVARTAVRLDETGVKVAGDATFKF